MICWHHKEIIFCKKKENQTTDIFLAYLQKLKKRNQAFFDWMHNLNIHFKLTKINWLPQVISLPQYEMQYFPQLELGHKLLLRRMNVKKKEKIKQNIKRWNRKELCTDILNIKEHNRRKCCLVCWFDNGMSEILYY